MGETIRLFFSEHLVQIFFIYGLAFFVSGIVLALEAQRATSPLTRLLPFLAAFGLIHGTHEWFEMFQIIAPTTPTTPSMIARILALALSFIILIEFGLRTLSLVSQRRWYLFRWIILTLFVVGEIVVWLLWRSDPAYWAAADDWARYCLAVPGAVLTAIGLFSHSRSTRNEQPQTSRDLTVVGAAFLIYGFPGQVFVNPSPLPPSNVINTVLFLGTFNFPIQLLRSMAATVVMVFTARAARSFELQRQQHIDDLNQARLDAQRQLAKQTAERDRLRRELLHQTVRAQEMERQHIARELHDEAGQALTAIAWGLAAVEDVLPERPDEARGRIKELRRLAEQVMTELRQLMTRLRPAVLDELGLVAALISYADDCAKRFPFLVNVEVTGQRRRLPSEVEIALYRFAQEAITNAAKHAKASSVSLDLVFQATAVSLCIRDDGVGMDVEMARQAAARGDGWGLAGIYERLELVGGRLNIESARGEGSELSVTVPLLASEEGIDESDQTNAG